MSTRQLLSEFGEEKRNLEEVNLELKEKLKDLEKILESKKQDFDNLNSDQAKTKEILNDFQIRNSLLEREISQLKPDYKVLENAANTNQRNVNSVSMKLNCNVNGN